MTTLQKGDMPSMGDGHGGWVGRASEQLLHAELSGFCFLPSCAMTPASSRFVAFLRGSYAAFHDHIAPAVAAAVIAPAAGADAAAAAPSTPAPATPPRPPPPATAAAAADDAAAAVGMVGAAPHEEPAPAACGQPTTGSAHSSE